MLNRLFQPGCRLLAVASLAVIVIGLIHAGAHFGPLWPRRDDGALGRVYDAMRGYRFDLGPGPRPSVMDFFRGLSLTMSILLVALGLQSLVVLAVANDPLAFVRPLAWVGSLALGALVVLFLVYRLAPVMLGTAFLLYLLAATLPRR
jgi:hypothetical protein